MVRECYEQQTFRCFRYGTREQMLRAGIKMTTVGEVLDLGTVGKVAAELLLDESLEVWRGPKLIELGVSLDHISELGI
jgi:hypothetical protein